MKNPKLVITALDETLTKLVQQTDKKTAVIWALDCAERVLHYFEDKYPKDNRPRLAIEAGRKWVKTGIFKMAVIRKASLDAHAAARNVQNDDIARSTARACGHAVATTHVKTHALGPIRYGLAAIRDATNSIEAVNKENNWQLQHLLDLKNQKH